MSSEEKLKELLYQHYLQKKIQHFDVEAESRDKKVSLNSEKQFRQGSEKLKIGKQRKYENSDLMVLKKDLEIAEQSMMDSLEKAENKTKKGGAYHHQFPTKIERKVQLKPAKSIDSDVFFPCSSNLQVTANADVVKREKKKGRLECSASCNKRVEQLKRENEKLLNDHEAEMMMMLKKNQSLHEMIQSKEEEIAAAVDTLDTATTLNITLQESLDNEQRLNSDVQSKVDCVVSELKTKDEKISNLTLQNNKLKNQIDVAAGEQRNIPRKNLKHLLSSINRSTSRVNVDEDLSVHSGTRLSGCADSNIFIRGMSQECSFIPVRQEKTWRKPSSFSAESIAHGPHQPCMICGGDSFHCDCVSSSYMKVKSYIE